MGDLGIHPGCTDWLTIERQLDLKEAELLRKEGVNVSQGHVDGYKYRPKIVHAEKFPWEVLPMPSYQMQCSSGNWSHPDLKFEVGEGIVYLTINRPDANNALNDTLSQALHDATVELHQRKDIRVVVLQAAGKLFCAGGDSRIFADAAAMTDADNRKAAVSFMKFLYAFQCLPQFTVGLAQGSAMGSGVGLLCACDMVVAVKGARFTVAEVKLGTTPATIAPYLSRKVGASHAKRLLCSAENITAEAAKTIGLVTQVVDSEADFQEVLEKVCEKMTLAAPLAAARAKRLCQNVSLQPLTTKLLEYTGGELASIRIGEEAIKGMIAVQAKTKPFWAETPVKPMPR